MDQQWRVSSYGVEAMSMMTPAEEFAFLERDIKFREDCVEKMRWLHENGVGLLSHSVRSSLFFEMQTVIEQLKRLKAILAEKRFQESRSLRG